MAKPPKASTTPRSPLHPDGRPKFDKRETKNYDPDKDPLLVGFQIGSGTYPNVTKAAGKKLTWDLDSYDFYSDPVTGLRPGETKEPYGTAVTSIRTSVGKYDVLPPIAVWQHGMWLWDAIFEKGFRFEELPEHMQNSLTKAIKDTTAGKVPQDFFSHYVVPGEGTPSNSVYRVYILPHDMGSEAKPKHPLMWEDKYKLSPGGYATGGGYGRSSLGQTQPTQTAVHVPVAPKVHLPASMRTRCGGCGHWWSIDDLAKHANVCPGVSGQGEADMAMMCDTRCGCETLDEASKCKPGFPRKPIAAKPKEDEPTLEEALAPAKAEEPAITL